MPDGEVPRKGEGFLVYDPEGIKAACTGG